MIGPSRPTLAQRFLAFIAWCILRLVARTLRIEVSGDEHRRGVLDHGGRAIFAFLHGQQFLLLAWSIDRPIAVMTSWSRDGALQTAILGRLGMTVTRGSSSNGAASGLKGMIREVRGGAHACIAVDGPRGPAGAVKPGVVALAAATGAAILPITANCRHGITLQNWDRYRIPLPFTRVRVVIGAPLLVSRREDPEPARALLEARFAQRW